MFLDWTSRTRIRESLRAPKTACFSNVAKATLFLFDPFLKHNDPWCCKVPRNVVALLGPGVPTSETSGFNGRMLLKCAPCEKDVMITQTYTNLSDCVGSGSSTIANRMQYEVCRALTTSLNSIVWYLFTYILPTFTKHIEKKHAGKYPICGFCGWGFLNFSPWISPFKFSAAWLFNPCSTAEVPTFITPSAALTAPMQNTHPPLGGVRRVWCWRCWWRI